MLVGVSVARRLNGDDGVTSNIVNRTSPASQLLHVVQFSAENSKLIDYIN